MWGVGASAGPYIMGYALNHGFGWNSGYLIVSIIQFVLTAILFFSLPLWKNGSSASDTAKAKNPDYKPLSLRKIIRIPGAKAVILAFFCYCAIEQTSILWGASYLVIKYGLAPEQVASMAGLFCLGITGGRAVSGFVTMKLNDTQMIRIGEGMITLGILCMFLPFGSVSARVGLILIGLGCAPIFPCMIHSTPAHFGADRSQAMIGVQMASAYLGICLMPPLFGVIARRLSAGLLPFYLGALLVIMIFVQVRLSRLDQVIVKKKDSIAKESVTPLI